MSGRYAPFPAFQRMSALKLRLLQASLKAAQPSPYQHISAICACHGDLGGPAKFPLRIREYLTGKLSGRATASLAEESPH